VTITLHASFLEWIFIATSLLSVCSSLYGVREANVDLDEFMIEHERRRQFDDAIIQVLADGNLTQEGLRFALSLVMFMISIIYLFLAPPPPDSYLENPQALVGIVGWIISSTVVAMKSLLRISVRRNIRGIKRNSSGN
jgi:hypothetical protein